MKQILAYLRSFLPSNLPRGTKELDLFIASILKTYNLPDKPSYHHAIATMVLHLDPITIHRSKRFFAKAIMKAQANEIAYQKIQDVREIEKKEEAEKKLGIDAPVSPESTSVH